MNVAKHLSGYLKKSQIEGWVYEKKYRESELEWR